jgi:hypothetical protein
LKQLKLYLIRFVGTTFIIGIKIILKYKTLKKKEFLFLGLSWILMSSPWWWTILNFATVLIFSIQLTDWMELFLSNACIPFVLIFWIYVYSYSMDLKYKKEFTVLISLISISYEIIVLIILFVNPDLIGYKVNSEVMDRTPLSLAFAISTALTIFITGVLFSVNSIRSADRQTHLRGYFLLVAFSLITFSAGFDSFGWQDIIIIIIIRSFLTLSSIFFYFGFFFPKKIINIFKKG